MSHLLNRLQVDNHVFLKHALFHLRRICDLDRLDLLLQVEPIKAKHVKCLPQLCRFLAAVNSVSQQRVVLFVWQAASEFEVGFHYVYHIVFLGFRPITVTKQAMGLDAIYTKDGSCLHRILIFFELITVAWWRNKRLGPDQEQNKFFYAKNTR